MRHTSIALAALLVCTQVPAAGSVSAEKVTRPQKVELRRGSPLPRWAQPLAEIPPTDRTDAVVLRLHESQALAGDQSAYLVNRAIQVNDRSALAAIGQVSLSYYSSYQTLALHRVAILRDGKVLDRTTTVDARALQRETAIESGMYGGATTIQLLLEDVRVGDTLWLTYSVAGANPVFDKHWFSEYSWDQLAPVGRRRLTVLYPKHRPIAWRQLGDFRADKIVPAIGSSGPYETLTFEGSHLEPLEDEQSIASDYFPARALQFTEFPDWQAVARWASGLFPQTSSDPILKGQVDQFRKQATPAARAAAALQWVQDEIRYFSVAIGENSHRPQSPGIVLKRRYGDCKDKSNLLIAILRELGIQARPVLLSASASRLPAKVAPSPGWFDHVIVELQVDNKTYYVDPTRTGQQVPLEALSTVFPGASGLVVDPATTALVVLPERIGQSPTFEVVESIAVEGYSGDATLETREIFSAELAEFWRQRLAALSPLELKKNALKDYEKRYPGIVLLGTPVITDTRITNQLEIRTQYRLPKAVNQVDGAQSIDYRVRPLEGVMALPDKLVRNFPLQMPAEDFHGRYRLNIQWPDDVRANELPWSRTIDNRFFQAQESYVFRGNHISHMVDYRAKARTVPAQEVLELHKEAKQLDELAYGRFTAHMHTKVEKHAIGFSARDIDLVRMAAAVDELALATAKLGDNDLPRDKACLLIRYAGYAEGLLEPVSRKAFDRARRVIKEDVNDPVAAACRARMAFESGDFATSASLYHQLSDDQVSKDARDVRNMAWAQLYRGQVEQASAAIQRYVEWQKTPGAHTGAELEVADRIAILQRSGRPLPPALTKHARDLADGLWPRPVLAMQVGLLGQDALIELIATMPEHTRAPMLTEAWFYVGQARLATGDKVGAAQAFRKLQEFGMRSSPLYLQGMGELRLLIGTTYAPSAAVSTTAGNAAAEFARLSEAANAGDRIAQFDLGSAYERGHGVAADPVKAGWWYRKAADAGHVKAYFALSELYRRGDGFPKDEEKSLALLRTSAELGDAAAMTRLGWRYQQGQGVAQDAAYSILWFQRAAVRGNVDAMYRLGLMLQRGEGVPQNLPAAAQLYLAAARQGHVDAQFELGYLYDKGQGVTKDGREAVDWYRKAAEQGHSQAQNNLGYCYEAGIGVPADEAMALFWMSKSAEQGNANGMASLGYLLENKKNKDPVQAHDWYRKAAELGNVTAQYNLGQQYRQGRGVPANPEQAFKWFSMAAQNGDLDAMVFVGKAYQDGDGIATDLAQTVRWYTAAADGGDALGALRLGILYYKAEGVGHDYERAHKLFEQAIAGGEQAGYLWLGKIYENGQGVAADLGKARVLYTKAPDVREAQIRLAVMGEYGNGGPRDPSYFSQVLESCAKANDLEGLFNLARAFQASLDGARAQRVLARMLELAEKSGNAKLMRVVLRLAADGYANSKVPLKAEPLYLRLLALNEEAYGREHEEVAETLEDLASVYKVTARVAQAEAMSRRALDIRLTKQGQGHRETWRSQRSLADIAGAHGDMAHARLYLAEVLSFIEAGPAQAALPAELGYTAKVYYDLGLYAEAETLYRRALAVAEADSGGVHTSWLTNGLAWTVGARGAHMESERLFRQAVALSDNQQGRERYGYAASLGGLGLQLSKLGRHDEAEQVLQQAMQLREGLLGKFDSEVVLALTQSGIGWSRQGKVAEAEAAFKRALALQEGMQTSPSFDFAETWAELAALYMRQQQFDKAEPFLKRALAIRKQLRPVHPDTRANEALVNELNQKARQPS